MVALSVPSKVGTNDTETLQVAETDKLELQVVIIGKSAAFDPLIAMLLIVS